MNPIGPHEHRDPLVRRLLDDAPAWRNAMPGPVRLTNPALADDPSADPLHTTTVPPRTGRTLVPSPAPHTVRWALAAALLLAGALLLVVSLSPRPHAPAPTPVDAASTALSPLLDNPMLLAADWMEDPLRREARNLAGDARLALRFLISCIAEPPLPDEPTARPAARPTIQ